jgi:hypothetical protein
LKTVTFQGRFMAAFSMAGVMTMLGVGPVSWRRDLARSSERGRRTLKWSASSISKKRTHWLEWLRRMRRRALMLPSTPSMTKPGGVDGVEAEDGAEGDDGAEIGGGAGDEEGEAK